MVTSLLAQADTLPIDAAANAAVGTAAGAAVAGLMGFLIFAWVLGLAGFIIIWLWALIDVIRREFTNPSDKTLWIIIVLLVPLGALIYLIVGRKKGTIPGAAVPAK